MAPSKKVTGPPRDLSALETVAVNLTDAPSRLGLLFEVRVTEVGSTVSTWPETLMMFGLLPALVGCVMDPSTGLPMTVGANSTPNSRQPTARRHDVTPSAAAAGG